MCTDARAKSLGYARFRKPFACTRSLESVFGRQREPGVPSSHRPACLWLSLAGGADTGERRRTQRDASERPQTVLKTAGPVSANVRQRPSEIGTSLPYSAFVRQRPPRFGMLAVILAVRTSAPLGRTVPNRPNVVSFRIPAAPPVSSCTQSPSSSCPFVSSCIPWVPRMRDTAVTSRGSETDSQSSGLPSFDSVAVDLSYRNANHEPLLRAVALVSKADDDAQSHEGWDARGGSEISE